MSVHPYFDSGVAHGAKPGPTGAHPTMVLASTILASGLAFVDGSVVNVALPTLAQSLNADAGALQWIVNAYLLEELPAITSGAAAF